MKRWEAQRRDIEFRSRIYRCAVPHERFHELNLFFNIHSREIRKANKDYYPKKFNTNLGKWKSLHEEEEQVAKGLLKA